MFLQIHTLSSYPASLLNRDDAGLAKRIPFGDATRLRVSSQCLKRHWREALTQQVPDVPDGLRTRSFFTRAVLPRAIEAGLPEETAKSMIKALADAVIKGGVDETGDMSQPVLLGLREAEYFVKMMVSAGQESDPVKALQERLQSKDEQQNLAAMSKSAAGLTAALFGRMVTSDLLARVDAPVHVAHAFTVHAANTEMDYFTVVDDLSREEETGTAHLNQSELGAGVYYGYVVVDVPLLVSNLTACETKDWRSQDPVTPRRVLEALVWAILRQSPGAKLGSTAPYAWADFLLLETGAAQPRSLANAFLKAIRPVDDVRAQAVCRLAAYLRGIDEMYGKSEQRFLSASLEAPFEFDGLAPKPVKETLQAALNALWS